MTVMNAETMERKFFGQSLRELSQEETTGNFTKEQILEDLREHLKASRFEHTLRVVQTAGELARDHGVSEEETSRIELAALVHDCAKSRERTILEELRGEYVEGALPDGVLLHGFVGALYANKVYGIKDLEILSAIAWHTTGRENMSSLEDYIYLADGLEPGRSYPGVEELRSLLKGDLNTAVLKVMDHTLIYLIQQGWEIHPMTVSARNERIRRENEQED